MSRAFGNRLLKQFVIAEPEIQVATKTFGFINFVTLFYFLKIIGMDRPKPNFRTLSRPVFWCKLLF